MKYRTKPKEFYALHDGATGKSVIQEVGSYSFQTDVDTAEWLQHHEPVTPAPRSVAAASNGSAKPRARRRTKAEIAADNAAAAAAKAQEPVLAGSVAE